VVAGPARRSAGVALWHRVDVAQPGHMAAPQPGRRSDRLLHSGGRAAPEATGAYRYDGACKYICKYSCKYGARAASWRTPDPG
jgi:hypothetical protein